MRDIGRDMKVKEEFVRGRGELYGDTDGLRWEVFLAIRVAAASIYWR
jgi:hypothetical protein